MHRTTPTTLAFLTLSLTLPACATKVTGGAELGTSSAPAGRDAGGPGYAQMDADVGGAPAPAAAEQLATAEPIARSKRAPSGDDATVGATLDRPGLGTLFGEQVGSTVISTSFERGNPNTPDVVLSLRYDDRGGVQDMARYRGASQWSGSRHGVGNDALVVKLVDERGETLPAAWIDGTPHAIGEADQRYVIGVENNSPYRYEAVASVDGLDVIDGEDATFHKRGYVLDPYTSMAIEGWRTSDDTVAAFRFSAIGQSYAERKGKGRNVGVIGVAFFHEEGNLPWAELQRRASATPFREYARPVR